MMLPLIGVFKLLKGLLILAVALGALHLARVDPAGWAEWFTVLVTASFVPLEIYEIARHPGAIRIGALVVNLAIVAYLVARLRRRRDV